MARVSLLSCGRCGKPRGLVHECAGRGKGPAFRLGPSFTCGTCGKNHGNPLTHQCAVKSDFRQRRAAQARREKAEERARKRKATAARRRTRAKARKAGAAERRKQPAREKREQDKEQKPRSNDRERHDYQACEDLDCSRYPCRVHREGKGAGQVEGYAEGYSEGYAAGMQSAMER